MSKPRVPLNSWRHTKGVPERQTIRAGLCLGAACGHLPDFGIASSRCVDLAAYPLSRDLALKD